MAPDESDLAAALGIGPGARVGVVNEPEGWLRELVPLPAGATLYERAADPLDVIVYFSDEAANVTRRLPALAEFLAPRATFWMAIPADSPELSPVVVEDVAQDAGLARAETLAIAPGWTALALRRS